MTNDELDQLAINTIRTLSIDAVQQAKSGHPGTPMALAPLVYTLWNRVMRFDPKDPIWPNRDRFVLSNGHASMLLWSVLHLTGTQAVNAEYERLGKPSVTLDDIRHFRQLEQQGAGPSRVSLGVGRRDDDRPARPGHRHQRRHGDRAQVAGQPLQPAGLRAVRLQHLRGVRRRLPDGRRRLGGGVARRPPRARQPVLDLRQQPHHHRGQHQHRVHRGCRGALPRPIGWNVLRVGDANDLERIEDALDGLPQDQGPADADHPRQPHRLRLAAQAGHRRRPRRAAGRRRDPAHQARLRLAGGCEVPGARRRAASTSPPASARAAPRRARRWDGALRRLPQAVSRSSPPRSTRCSGASCPRAGTATCRASRPMPRASPAATPRARC